MQKSTGCLIYKIEDNQPLFFLVKPTNNKKAKFGIPKGLVDDHESVFEAAIRETKEESGLIFDEDYLIPCAITCYNKKVVYCFLTKYISGKFNCTSYFEMYGKQFPEVTDGRFFTYNEALDSIMDAQKKFIEEGYKLIKVKFLDTKDQNNQ